MRNEAVTLRAWRVSDVDAIVRHANNRNVWKNLRDLFPHPYSKTDAETWVGICAAQAEPAMNLAIDVDGEAVGGIGLSRGEDVESHTAEVGYWLGESFWGKGVATRALELVTAYAFARVGLSRVFAMPFAWNPASARVLEKAGYRLEGRLRRAAKALLLAPKISRQLPFLRL